MLLSLWLLVLRSALAGLLAAPAPPTTVLSGHLDHAPAGDSVRLWVGEKRVATLLSPGGDFRFEFKDLKGNMPTEFSYAGQRTQLYLVPGNKLVMNLDFKEFDKSLGYRGKGSELNNYLAQALYKYQYGPAGDLPRPQDNLETTPAEIRRLSDAYRQSRLAYLTTYAQAHLLPLDFQHDERLAIDIDWATTLLLYAHRNWVPGKDLPETYYSFLQEISLTQISQHLGRSLLDNSLVANFVVGYQYRLVPSGKLGLNPAAAPRLYQLATAELGDTPTRDWVMRALLFMNISNNLPGALAFYPTFKLHNPDSTVARAARESFVKRQLLDIGKPAPAFTLLDNTGKQVSLSDFKGKVVYLDFWGTWCGPCMREMTEFAPALKKQFEGRDVVFLYISVGDAEAKWQQMLVSQQFLSANAVHLRSPNSLIAADYQVNGYPSYYLIDRAGRLIQPYTSRPSDGVKTVAAIEQALAQ